MCWHKWDKWEQYKIRYNQYWNGTTLSYPVSELRQKRICVKCGKMQDEEVRNI
jgi:hypothetical protein